VYSNLYYSLVVSSQMQGPRRPCVTVTSTWKPSTAPVPTTCLYRVSVFGYDDMELSFILVILTACTDSLHGSNKLVIGTLGVLCLEIRSGTGELR
jgi:hypothetical protein